MPVPAHGQVAVTGSAQQLTSNTAQMAAFEIYAPLTNANPVYVGAAGVSLTTGHQLDPGKNILYESLSQSGQPLYQLRPSDFYVVGTSGDKVTWLGSPS